MTCMGRWVWVGVAFLLFACSGGESNDPASSKQSRVPENNVYSDQVRALEKAESVENTLLRGSADRNKAIEQQAR